MNLFRKKNPQIKRKEQKELQLIKGAKKDPLIFGQLYDKYYGQIFGFIYKRTNNFELALDLTSETFFQGLKNLWRYKFQGKSFSCWLYKIAITQISNFYRQRSKYCEITLEQAPDLIANPAYQPDSLYEQSERQDELKNLARQIYNLLSKLNPQQHTALVLKYYENKTLKEIAEIMNAKENTIKSHLRRGLINLQKLLGNSQTVSLSTSIPQTKELRPAFIF